MAQHTVTINATVVRSCHLLALPMMFGTVSIINPLSDATAAMFVDCTPVAPFTVNMDNGLHFQGGDRMTAYGRVDAPRVVAGAYEDTITVTTTF